MNWRNIPFIRTAGLVLLAVLAALAGAKVGRSRSQARREENRAQELLADGSEKAMDKAKVHMAKAEVHKQRMKERADAAQKKLDNFGKADGDIADAVNRWGVERLSDDAG